MHIWFTAYVLFQSKVLVWGSRRAGLVLHEVLEAAGPLQAELQTHRETC